MLITPTKPQTTYEAALNEFRDASAACRRAFGAVCEAREVQIIADSQHKTASTDHVAAMARLDAAEKALMAAREAPGVSGNATTMGPSALGVVVATGETANTSRVTQDDIDAIEPRANGTIDAQSAGIGIG